MTGARVRTVTERAADSSDRDLYLAAYERALQDVEAGRDTEQRHQVLRRAGSHFAPTAGASAVAEAGYLEGLAAARSQQQDARRAERPAGMGGQRG